MAEDQGAVDTSHETLKSLENWCHLHGSILKAGRCSHYVPPTVGEDDKEGFIAALDEKDKAADPLAEIAKDMVSDAVTGKLYPDGEVPEGA